MNDAATKRIMDAFEGELKNPDLLIAAHAAHKLARALFVQNLTFEERLLRNVKRHYNANAR